MKPLAIILNILFPGLGTLILGKILTAFFQWAIWAFGMFLSFSIIGAIFGFPFVAIGWIWALVTAVKYQEPTEIKRGVQYPPSSSINS